jgi:muconolactone delta-isomerase
MSKLFRVQGEYTYTVFKIVEADNEEEAILTAQDSEPLCAWETVEKNGYEEYVESAVEEKTNE